MKRNAIVLLSGGQDSTTCLLWAIAKYGKENIQAVGFHYGQKHSVELEQAHEIAKLLEVPYKVFDIMGTLGGSSLTDHSKDVNAPHDKNQNLPSSFTAGRNALFLTIAASYGYGQNIHTIVTGVCQTDFTAYPDCRQVFIKAQQTSLSLAMDVDIWIRTPLMYLTKAETWKLAADVDHLVRMQYPHNFGMLNCVDIVRLMTMTDYNGNKTMNEWGMGDLDNPASQLRAKGYYEAIELGYIERPK